MGSATGVCDREGCPGWCMRTGGVGQGRKRVWSGGWASPPPPAEAGPRADAPSTGIGAEPDIRGFVMGRGVGTCVYPYGRRVLMRRVGVG